MPNLDFQDLALLQLSLRVEGTIHRLTTDLDNAYFICCKFISHEMY